MTVYVDNAMIPYGRMIMSHMTADTLDELHEMARQIDLHPKWFQSKSSTPHYNLCKAYRSKAISLGAIQETVRAGIIRRKSK